jgi:hypothetical protein
VSALSEDELQDASEQFVSWLERQVMSAGRGDGLDRLETEPRGTFWLGRLAPEDYVRNNPLGSRAEKLDPCAISLRVRPAAPGPWSCTVHVRLVAWLKAGANDWRKSDPVTVAVVVNVQAGSTGGEYGGREIKNALASVGAAAHSAVVRVEVEDWRATTELVISLVNDGPEADKTNPDTHLYETSFEIRGLQTQAFELEALPDSFRYDRRVAAIPTNCGVQGDASGIRTTDVVSATKSRPKYWTGPPEATPDLTFDRLITEPLPEIKKLIAALKLWGEENWSLSALAKLGIDWNEDMHAEAARAAQAFQVEVERLEAGSEALQAHPQLLKAFQLANAAIKHAARGRYDSWRAFQLGFLVSAMVALVEPTDADTVDTVWFATGGGKTETYLGLLVTAVLYDRMTGKQRGISAWSRFPLRMLSLQQTQRFADALAGAELARQREKLGGAPLALGFFVGQGGTPNRINLEPKDGEPDPTDPKMPGHYQVLMRCPFCHGDTIEMRFDRGVWRLEHRCPNEDCPWKSRALPFYVVDQEIFRFLPAVVVGTLDKAALIGMQAAMRGLVGPPLGECSMEGHGYCYSARSKTPTGCLVPGCRGQRQTLGQDRALWAPRLRLQDELHLLRDSLGAVDAHYEAALDHLQKVLGSPRAKVVASSATLTGFERQVDVLYQRQGRVFPQPGPTEGSSFWTQSTSRLARRYVAVAPRGLTLEFVNDRTVTVLQQSWRRLLDDPANICLEAGIDPGAASHLQDLYGVNVVYGNTVRDVEAARRSVDTQIPFKVNAETLTGGTPFDDVRVILEKLEKPEADPLERIHVVAASSMLSHGVDIDRLNTMVMLGLPLTTAEFIQTTARVGRRWPGLVYVLHRIGREREHATYAQFDKFVSQGDRFVEPIPITRRSRRVLSLTTSGLAEARRLLVHEPASGKALTTVKWMRDHYQTAGINAADEVAALSEALGLEGPMDEFLRVDLESWMRSYFGALNDPATSVRWPNELSPSGSVMRSLRDVEESAPVMGDD